MRRLTACTVIGTVAVSVTLGLAARRSRRAAAQPLPGDELLPAAPLVITRGARIAAPPERVWPWLAQLGQRRAGFYSFTLLENAMGCRMPEKHRIVPQWQQLAAGDPVHLTPEAHLCVAEVEPGRCLVLTSDGGLAPGASAPGYRFTWAFHLAATDGGSRLTVRERYAPSSAAGWAAALAGRLGSAVMSRRMLATIARLAERG